jgi:integrase
VAARPDPGDWGEGDLVTVAEAAALAWPDGPVPARTLRRAIADGHLPARRLAGRHLIELGDLAALLPAFREPASGDAGTADRALARPEGTGLRLEGAARGARRQIAGAGGDPPNERPRRRADGVERERWRDSAWQPEGAPPPRGLCIMATQHATIPVGAGDGPVDIAQFMYARNLIEISVRIINSAYDIRVRPEQYTIQQRGHRFVLYRTPDGGKRTYLGVLKATTWEEAERKKDERVLLDAADALGIVDPRNLPATKILDDATKTIGAAKKSMRRAYRWAIKVIRPYVKGRRLHQLDPLWAAKTIKRLLKRYAPYSVYQIFAYLRRAIIAKCKQLGTTPLQPFPMPPKPKRSPRILKGHELRMIERYVDGVEFYDAATDTWSIRDKYGREATAANRHSRKMAGRALRLAMATGTRGGRLARVAWRANSKFPFIDLETGCLYRVPLGKSAATNKRAPIVRLPPTMVELLRRWREEDGPDAVFVINAIDGKPYKCAVGALFRRVTKALGIDDLPFHRTRHTVITLLVRAGVPLPVISAQCGISIRLLEECYSHVPGHILQPIAHPALDRILKGDVPDDIDLDELGVEWLDGTDWDIDIDDDEECEQDEEEDEEDLAA